MKDYTYRRLDLDPTFINRIIGEWERVHDPEFYNISVVRERISYALRHTRTYHLRSPDIQGAPITTLQSTQDVLAMKDKPLYESFPMIKEFVDHVGHAMFGGWSHLGRVFITQIAPNESIDRHTDEGKYFDTLHRFHLVLRSGGSKFFWDNDTLVMHQGEAWMINNSIPHWVNNLDCSARIHLIFDGA